MRHATPAVPAPPGLVARYVEAGCQAKPVVAFDPDGYALVVSPRGGLLFAQDLPGFRDVVHVYDRPSRVVARYVTYDAEANAAFCRIFPDPGGGKDSRIRCIEVAGGRLVVEVNPEGDLVAVEAFGVKGGWLDVYRSPGDTADPQPGTVDDAGAQT